jgi:hypothetical protein
MAYQRATRNQVNVALFNLLKSMPVPAGFAFVTQSLRLKQWDDVPSAAQPAQFLHQGPQKNDQLPGTLALSKWTWPYTLWIYFRGDSNQWDDANNPVTVINDLVDGVEKVLDPVPGERQTLGGLCYHCWMEAALWDDGLVDNQAVILIPITVRMGI